MPPHGRAQPLGCGLAAGVGAAAPAREDGELEPVGVGDGDRDVLGDGDLEGDGETLGVGCPVGDVDGRGVGEEGPVVGVREGDGCG